MLSEFGKYINSFHLRSNVRLALILSFIFTTITNFPVMAQTCNGIPDSECQALYAFYHSTNGDNWADNTNWLSDKEVRLWNGIIIEGGHVIALLSDDNNLSGVIPPELGNLTNLWVLGLSNSNLTGTIPHELGSLTNLGGLHLNSNRLSGTIPPELGDLVKLEALSLYKNNLSGIIPPELGKLPLLRDLKLHSNNLSGEIPSSLGNTNLMKLYLYSNNLTGSIPPELGNLSSLHELYLYSNYLTGKIPSELGNIPLLRRINISSNNLSGEIPPELHSSNIQELKLSSNNLSGDLPIFLTMVTGNIDLSYNCLYASDPDVLAAVEDKHAEGFISTQTLTPENISAAVVTDSGNSENRIEVSWDPIAYTADPGGYKVFYRKTGATEFIYGGMTHDKEASSFRVSNLEPGTEYEFMVNAVTWQHKYNRQDLYSLDSNRVSATAGTLARAFIPNWKQAPGYFTGVVVANFGDTDFDVDLAAFDPDGNLETLGQNPAGYTVEAGLQKSKLGVELFSGDPYHEDFSWIELGAENSNRMGSIFLYGVSDTQMLDGAEAQSTYAKKLFFTRPLDEGFFAGWSPEFQMCIVNPTDEEVTVNCTIKGSNGESSASHTIPAGGFIKGDSEDLTNTGHGIIDGYLEIEVTDGPGVVGFSRIEFPGVRTALGMNAVTSSTARTMYSAQLAHGFNIVTNLRLVNTGGRSRTVTLTAIGDTGTPLADPVQVDIDSEQIYSADLGTLFGLESEGIINTGSLVVESDGFGIIGDIIFADGDTLEYAMSLPLQDKLFKEAVFNHIANLPSIFTGFAFYNPGNVSATVLIEAIGTDGSKVAEKTLILDPGERIARTLMDPDMWPEFPIQSGGYIKIQSDQPIAGQQLFGDTALRYMAAIPPTTRLEPMFD